MESDRLTLSIVIPVFNEEENIPILAEEIRRALEPQGVAYEVIAVDDGSTDGILDAPGGGPGGGPRWILVAAPAQLRPDRGDERRLP